MFKNKILKKIGAGLMAGLCAFTMIGTNIGGLKTSAATTAKEPLLSGDEVIKQAAKYLGVPYGWDCKGYEGVYSSSSPKKQSMETVRKKVLTAPVLSMQRSPILVSEQADFHQIIPFRKTTGSTATALHTKTVP